MSIEITAQGTEVQAMTPLRIDAGDTVSIGNVSIASSHTDTTTSAATMNAAPVTIDGVEYLANTVVTYTLATTAQVTSDRETFLTFTYTTASGDIRKVRETITVKPHFAAIGGTAVYGAGLITALTAAPAQAVYPGIYHLDATGGVFTVLLQQVRGMWLFLDPTGTTASNNVSVGTGAQTFNGTAGPLTINGSHKEVRVINLAATNAYRVSL